MAGVMIGAGSHKAPHTAVAISGVEEPPGQLRVRVSVVQAERLLALAAAWPERTGAVEGAGSLSHLLPPAAAVGRRAGPGRAAQAGRAGPDLLGRDFTAPAPNRPVGR
jgi:hypothetical protein